MTFIKHTSTASVVESRIRLEIPPIDLIVSASEARAVVGLEGLGKERSVSDDTWVKGGVVVDCR